MLAFLVGITFFAGFVDAIAGGGGLITLPALLFAGLPPHLALATNKGQSVFGSGTAVLAYSRKGAVKGRRALLTFPLAFAGSFLGARAVLAIPPATERLVVIVLLLGAAATLLFRRKEALGQPPAPARAALYAAALAAVIGAYDGFFGPGTGTFLVVGFSVLLHEPLLGATGDAKVVNFASNLAAVATFAWRGNVLWHVSLPMAVAQLSGAWTGAHVAVKGGDRVIRPAVLLVVVALVAKLAWDLAHG